MNKLKTKLQPCAHCEGRADILKIKRENRLPAYRIFCTVCQIRTFACALKWEAVKSWNTRVTKESTLPY